MNPRVHNDNSKIYFDYNATTPLAEEVIASIAQSLANDWGNPSSDHEYGVISRKSIHKARVQLAKMLNAQSSSEIIFTSGGTEANNMIIFSVLQYFKQYQEYNLDVKKKNPHIITSNVEHDSVLSPIMQLKKLSLIDYSIVEVNKKGVVEVDSVLSSVQDNTCLITIMSANNETGVIMPISEIGRKLKRINEDREKRGRVKILFHTDAAQFIGKERANVDELGVDFITVVGHKFHGPRIGCIWARGPLFPIFFGGGQEGNLRPGTENTPMIVGLGVAAELVSLNLDRYREHMMSCRELLEKRLKEVFGDGVTINCGEVPRLSNTSNVAFAGEALQGKLILGNCKHLIAGVGAACHGGKCSQVLINSGVHVQLARNSIRLSLGRDTNPNDIETAVMDLHQAVKKLKSTSN